MERGKGKRGPHPEKRLMRGRLFGIGSVLGALVTAICCLGPILFSLLGLSTLTSLWLLRNLVPYRNLFFAITLLFLGLGFYAAYGHGRARSLDRVILWSCTILVLALLWYTLYTEGLRVF